VTTAELDLATRNVATSSTTTMKALIYHALGKRAWENRPQAAVQDHNDAIVRITTATICGTDFRILSSPARRCHHDTLVLVSLAGVSSSLSGLWRILHAQWRVLHSVLSGEHLE
jgi:hypothetical protein